MEAKNWWITHRLSGGGYQIEQGTREEVASICGPEEDILSGPFDRAEVFAEFDSLNSN